MRGGEERAWKETGEEWKGNRVGGMERGVEGSEGEEEGSEGGREEE